MFGKYKKYIKNVDGDEMLVFAGYYGGDFAKYSNDLNKYNI